MISVKWLSGISLALALCTASSVYAKDAGSTPTTARKQTANAGPASLASTDTNCADLSAPELLRFFNSNFGVGYLKKEDDLNEPFPNGKVMAQWGQNSDGMKQIALLLQDGEGKAEKIYLSRVGKVQALKQGGSEHLLLEQLTELPKQKGVTPLKRSYYDLLVRGNVEVVAGCVKSLRELYGLGGETKKYSSPETPPPLALTFGEQRDICKSLNLEGYQITLVGERHYQDCEFNGEEDSGLTAAISSAQKQSKGVLVFCGSADRRSDKKCEKGNFELSYRRAVELMNQTTQGKGMVFPLGTFLDEKSARVYLVTPEEVSYGQI